MFGFDRRRTRAFAPALVLWLAALLAGASPVAAQDLRLDLVWLGSDDPGSGGVHTDRLAAGPGDVGTLGVYVTPGFGGLSSYDLGVTYDAALANGLDVVGATATPPPGWLGAATPTVVESDASQPGVVSGFAASGPAAPLPADGEVKIGEIQFRFSPGGIRDDFAIDPFVASYADASGAPGDPADVASPGASLRLQENQNEPSFRPAFGTYGFAYDLGGVRIRSAVVCNGCEAAAERGAVLRSHTDGGFGFFQSGVPLNGEFRVGARIDTSLLISPGAFAGVELDSPPVPAGVVPQRYFFVGAAREVDGSVTLFANDSGADVGSPVNVLEDEIELDWAFYENRLDVSAIVPGGVPQPLVVGYEFPLLGGGGLGFGLSGAGKGDAAGFVYEISGDLYDAPRKKLLSELDEVITLEREAEQALAAGNRATAQRKLEQAKERIEKGKKVPGSKPVRYEGSLLDQVDAAIPDAKTRDAIRSKLRKVAAKDGKAIDGLKKGAPAKKIAKAIRSATKRKLQAKAMIETANRKEKPKAT